MSDRLDAFLAHRGFGSRSQVRGLIRSGAVTLDGAVCRDHSARVDGRAVSVGGEVVPVGVTEATLLMNKPLGYACSHDPDESPLLEELLPGELSHLPLETAGRLDRDTSGLLVITTDGDLIHSLTNPRRHVLKRYRVRYRGKLSHHAVARCVKGIRLPDDPRPTRPARLELEGVDEVGLGRATLHLAEGRYHQVRRMFAELGGEVVALHRDRIGALELPADLTAGTVRELTDRERELLFAEPEDAKPKPKPEPAKPKTMKELLAEQTKKVRKPT